MTAGGGQAKVYPSHRQFPSRELLETAKRDPFLVRSPAPAPAGSRRRAPAWRGGPGRPGPAAAGRARGGAGSGRPGADAAGGGRWLWFVALARSA